MAVFNRRLLNYLSKPRMRNRNDTLMNDVIVVEIPTFTHVLHMAHLTKTISDCANILSGL